MALCVAVPALTVGSPAAHAETPDPRPSIHRSAKGVLSYDDPRYDGRRTIAVTGTVQTTIGESFDGRVAQQSQAVVTSNGDTIPVSTRGTALPTGGRIAGDLVVTDSATQPVAAATVTPAAVAAAPAATVHHAYVAVVGTTLPTMTTQQASALADKITGYWNQQSKNSAGTSLITWSSTPAPVIYQSAKASTCVSEAGSDGIWNEAATRFPGVSFSGSSPNHLIVLLPGCGGGGIGTVGTSLASGGKSAVALQSGAEFQIGAHELGHNVGLGHANIEYCDTGGANCAIDAYGNAYSPMASVLGGPNSPNPSVVDTVFRQVLQLTDSTEVEPVTLPFGAPQKMMIPVSLGPRASTTDVRAAEIIDPFTNQKLVAEYRSGTGLDANTVYNKPNYSEDLGDHSNAPFRPGVVISRLTSVGATTGPVNLLMTKRIDSDSVQTSFGAGESYVSPTGNIKIDVVAATTSGADINVTLDGPFLQSAKPTVTGIAQVGKDLTAQEGPWEDGTEFTYQWLSNGTPIAGATARTYRATTYGRTLAVRVEGVKAGRLTVRQTSGGVFVERGIFTTVTPTITGTARVGRTLSAHHGSWIPTPSWTYQWRANGHTIIGATRSTYVISTSRIGQRITVIVTGRRAGYITKSRGSSSTAVVKR